MRIKYWVLAFVILTGTLCAHPAAARDAGGLRWFLRAPSSTRPAFASPGSKFPIDVATSVYNSCSCAFHVFLLTPDGRQVEVYNARIEQPADQTFYRFLAAVPEDMPPGLYDVILKKGANNDVGKRALYVMPPDKKSLRIMHISLDGAPDPTLAEAARAASDTVRPDVVVITGVPPTALHEPGRGKSLVETIDRFTAPTIVQSAEIPDDPLNEFLGPAENVICAGGAAFAMFAPDLKTGAAPESVRSAVTACGNDAIPIWLPIGEKAAAFKSDIGITLMDADNKQKAESLSSKNILATPPLQEGYMRAIHLNSGIIIRASLFEFMPLQYEFPIPWGPYPY